MLTRLLALAVAGAGVALFWVGIQARINQLEAALATSVAREAAVTTSRDAWRTRAEELVAQVERLADERRRAAASAAALRDDLDRASLIRQQAVARVDASPASDDGPVAPVLRRALHELE